MYQESNPSLLIHDPTVLTTRPRPWPHIQEWRSDTDVSVFPPVPNLFRNRNKERFFFFLSPSEIDPRPFKEPRPVEAEAELLLGIWSHLEVQLWWPNYSRHDFVPKWWFIGSSSWLLWPGIGHYPLGHPWNDFEWCSFFLLFKVNILKNLSLKGKTKVYQGH